MQKSVQAMNFGGDIMMSVKHDPFIWLDLNLIWDIRA